MKNSEAFLSILVCPKDRSTLKTDGDTLACKTCGTLYPIRSGIPQFYLDPEWEDLYLNDGGQHYATEEPFELAPGDLGYLALRGDQNYGTVLDLGCGDGVFSSIISKQHQSYCVDVTETGLRRLQKRQIKNLYPLLASGFELPFPKNTFDTALYVFVVEHLASGDDLRMLLELQRVLKDSGKLIYTTDTPFFDKHLVRWTNLLFRGKWTKQDHSSETGHINLLTLKQSRALVQRAGFDIHAEHPYWMGSRFPSWMRLVTFFRNWLPREFCENYLTSKYTLILKKSLQGGSA